MTDRISGIRQIQVDEYGMMWIEYFSNIFPRNGKEYKMSDNEQVIKRIGELERKISDGESLLRRTVEASTLGWVFLAVGVILVFVLWGGFWSVMGALFALASVWRLYTAAKFRKEIEDGLREYRGQRAEFLASLMSKD